MDTALGAKTYDESNLLQSTVSRYACRIVVQRHPPYTARIYAAGFDTSKNIFLGVCNLFSFGIIILIWFLLNSISYLIWFINRRSPENGQMI